MNETKQRPVGLTKNTGFQVGIRRTFSVSIEKAWDFLFSKKGLGIWLGQIEQDVIEINNEFETSEGLKGKIKIFKPNSHVRLSWKPEYWDNQSTLQIRVIPVKTKTTISFHQENLKNEAQRTDMKNHWEKILDEFSGILA